MFVKYNLNIIINKTQKHNKLNLIVPNYQFSFQRNTEDKWFFQWWAFFSPCFTNTILFYWNILLSSLIPALLMCHLPSLFVDVCLVINPQLAKADGCTTWLFTRCFSFCKVIFCSSLLLSTHANSGHWAKQFKELMEYF